MTPVSLLILKGVDGSARAPNKQQQEEQEALGEEHCVRDSEKWAEVLSTFVCTCALVFFSLVLRWHVLASECYPVTCLFISSRSCYAFVDL